MKRLIAVALSLLMLLSCLVIPSFASEEGLSFDGNTVYRIKDKFEVAPMTYEAWIKVPTTVKDGGAIFGSEGFETYYTHFGVANNGSPRLKYYGSDKAVKDLIFSDCDVRGDEWVHLAITFDVATQKAICYINGDAAQTLAVSADYYKDMLTIPMALGGTQVPGNKDYFKGSLRSVTLYSDVRTAEEIKADMNAVNPSADNIIAHYDLSDAAEKTVIENACGNQYTATSATVWITEDEKTPVTDYEYSFCIVGDTQIVTQKTPSVLRAMYQWIVKNKDEKKISFVFGMGDITHKDTNDEWEVAKLFIDQLNGKIPYSLVRGNHDSADQMNKTFNTESYTSQFEGFYKEGDVCNSWTTFRAGSVDYLHVTIDYGAGDAILNWASEIIEEHPEHRVIISTHAYLDEDGTTLDYTNPLAPNKTGADNGTTNNGDQMWNKLIKKHENIFMVFSGHIGSTDVIMTQTEGDHGNVVTQFLINPQVTDLRYRATGMVTMLYFSNDGKTVTVEQYSTNDQKYFMSTSQFTFTVPKDEHAVNNGTEEVPPSTDDSSDVTDSTVEKTDAPSIPTEESTSDTGEAKKSGCSESISFGAVAILVCLPLPLCITRKKRRR